jgi:hypothetical protein
MSAIQKQTVISAAEEFEAVLRNVSPDPRRDKALYHLDRLRSAVSASHQEAVRFAAFTINKTIHDASGEWGAAAVEAMTALRGALHDAGHEF